MVTLFHISAPIICIIGAWKIVYAIKHCHDPDFTIQLVLGFFSHPYERHILFLQQTHVEI